MDVPKIKKESLFDDSKKIAIIIIVILSLLAIAAAFQSSGSVSVKRSDIIVGAVKRGDIDIVVEGYGELVSNKKQLVTADSAATVKEIVLKPGAAVVKGNIIVIMESTEVSHEVGSARQDLMQTKANLRQLKVTHQRELLSEQATLEEIISDYETARLKKESEEKLVDKGVIAVLSYKSTVLEEQQLKRKVEIYSKRLEQLSAVHRETINIELERIKQQQSILDIAQDRVDKLIVKASFDGILQGLSVQLGQRITQGQEIALIGSNTDLVAMIKVPQSKAQLIKNGQNAVIDTRHDKITGMVSRIDPIVEDNTVTIEVELPSPLPASARPQMSVDGVISTGSLNNVLYMERPVSTKTNTEINLYQLNTATNSAVLRRVKLGRSAGRYIEILSGADINDTYILSQLSKIGKGATTLEITP